MSGELFALADAVGRERWIGWDAGWGSNGGGVGPCCWVDGPVRTVLRVVLVVECEV